MERLPFVAEPVVRHAECSFLVVPFKVFWMEIKPMSSSMSTVVGPQSETTKSRRTETLVFEPRKAADARIHPTTQRKGSAEEPAFRSSMLEWNRMKRSSRPLDFLLSLLVNATILVAPVLAGLYFTDTINLKQFETTFLIAPPPPPPPPSAPIAAVAPARQVHRVFQQAGKLVAPIAVPKQIAVIKEAPISDQDFGGVAGGVPGGVTGGSMGGVIGGVIGGISSAVPKAPLAPSINKPKAPVRVGGSVRAPKVIVRVEPDYPALARQTHVQGVVVVDAILDEKGNVEDMKIVSGPVLLYKAALDALRKWKYEPSYLNDQPVAVELLVTITFNLNER